VSVTSLLKAWNSDVKRMTQHLVSPQRRLEAFFQRLDELSQRLPIALRTQLTLHQMRLQTLLSRVHAGSPRSHIIGLERDIAHVRQRLASAVRLNLAERAQALVRFQSILRAVGPTATLERGYAIVTDDTGMIVTDAARLKPADEVTTRLARGHFKSSVTSTEKD
jgi:exodeoxyribonuclease VII large subunit